MVLCGGGQSALTSVSPPDSAASLFATTSRRPPQLHHSSQQQQPMVSRMRTFKCGPSVESGAAAASSGVSCEASAAYNQLYYAKLVNFSEQKQQATGDRAVRGGGGSGQSLQVNRRQKKAASVEQTPGDGFLETKVMEIVYRRAHRQKSSSF